MVHHCSMVAGRGDHVGVAGHVQPGRGGGRRTVAGSHGDVGRDVRVAAHLDRRAAAGRVPDDGEPRRVDDGGQRAVLLEVLRLQDRDRRPQVLHVRARTLADGPAQAGGEVTGGVLRCGDDEAPRGDGRREERGLLAVAAEAMAEEHKGERLALRLGCREVRVGGHRERCVRHLPLLGGGEVRAQVVGRHGLTRLGAGLGRVPDGDGTVGRVDLERPHGVGPGLGERGRTGRWRGGRRAAGRRGRRGRRPRHDGRWALPSGRGGLAVPTTARGQRECERGHDGGRRRAAADARDHVDQAPCSWATRSCIAGWSSSPVPRATTFPSASRATK